MTLKEAALCPLRTRRGAYIKLREAGANAFWCCYFHEEAVQAYELLKDRVIAAGLFTDFECEAIAAYEAQLNKDGVLEI